MFFGKYQIINRLGEGSLANVRKVKDIETGECFAAKIIKKPIDKLSEQEQMDIQREIGILSHIKHPSIAEFVCSGIDIDIDVDGKFKKIIMIIELGERTLHQVLKNKDDQEKNGWNDTKKMITIYSIASAISFLHSKKIVYRDLSPKNIMFDKDFNVKIVDFGFSKVLNGSNEFNSNKLGTLWYCPPEAIRGKYSESGDVYAFSIIVYEILTNEQPYLNNIDNLTLLNKVCNGTRPLIPSDFNNSWNALIRECWDEDPEKRPKINDILYRIRNDENFILEKADKDEYQKAIERCDRYQGEFDSNIDIDFHQFIENKERTIKKVKAITENIESTDPNIGTEHDQSNDNEQETTTENIESIYQKGRSYEFGKNADIKKAAMYYQKAADKDHIDAMSTYGLMLMEGKGVEKDEIKAAFYLKKAADCGKPAAMFNYAYLVSHFDQPNYQESCLYYEMAANRGNVNAMNNFGLCLYNGKGCSVNMKEACKFFKMAADHDLVRGFYNYGLMNDKGYGTDVNKKTAFDYYKKAADNNYRDGALKVSKMLSIGDGIPKNTKESNKYSEKAFPIIEEKREWHQLQNLDDFGITEKSINNKNHIKIWFVKATKQEIIAKLAVDNDIEKLRNEYNNLLQFNHPVIQKVIGFYEYKNENKAVLLTQYYKKLSLDINMKEIKKEYKTNENKITKPENDSSYNDIYKIIYGIVHGMKHLEDKHLFHGNLNPSNILLDKYGYPIINNIQIHTKHTDNELNKSNTSNKYLAPEIQSGEEISSKSDAFSLGVIINELFSNEPREVSENLPPFLFDIVKECLDHNPVNRPKFSIILTKLQEAFSKNDLITSYEKKIEEGIECPIDFFRPPKVIADFNELKSEENKITDNGELSCKNFFIQQNLLNVFQNIQHNQKIKLIIVCGKYQSGKSTFLRTLTGNGAFFSGNGSQSTTIGILIDGPYLYKDIINRVKKIEFKKAISDYEKYKEDNTAIFFIDSQGLGDEKFKHPIYSSIFQRYLSFFCAISDLCINISQMNDSYHIFDDIINSIRQGQIFKQSIPNFYDNLKLLNKTDNQEENNNNQNSVNILQTIINQIKSFKIWKKQETNEHNDENNNDNDNDDDNNNDKNNDNNNDEINFCNDLSKILFLVRYNPEMIDRDPNEAKSMNSINIFDEIQLAFQDLYFNEHQIIVNNYLQNCIKSLPLCDLDKSLESYVCSVWYTVPDIVSFLINSEDHTKDYIQDKVEVAISFLFSDFFNKFFTTNPNVKDQIRFVAKASLNLINQCIEEYQNRIKSKEETLDLITQYFSIIKNIIIPFTIGLDSTITIQDKNQYSYDLMKDLTAYTAHCIPELKENLYHDLTELFITDIKNALKTGIKSAACGFLSMSGQLAKRILPLVIPAVGEIITGVFISLSIISLGSHFVYFIDKFISMKDKVEEIQKTNIPLSFPFLWEINKYDNKIITNISGFGKSNKIRSKVHSSEIIVALENKESNIIKFIIQSMTGITTNYEMKPSSNKEIIVYGPFKPNKILKRASRYSNYNNSKKWESFISKDIYIVYLRAYDINDLQLLESMKDKMLFILSTRAISLYPKFETLKTIYMFDFMECKNIVYLKKNIYEKMQKNENKEINNCVYKIITLPILMDDCNSFDSIGPVVNKCLRSAIHKIFTIKE